LNFVKASPNISRDDNNLLINVDINLNLPIYIKTSLKVRTLGTPYYFNYNPKKTKESTISNFFVIKIPVCFILVILY